MSVEEGGETEGYDLFEIAARSLIRDNVAEDEKLQILNTLLRNVPTRTAAFLYNMVKDADLFLRRQLIGLLDKVDNPVVSGIYLKFVSDKESFLRLRGIMGLNRLGLEEGKRAIISAADDSHPSIRRLVANCLSSTAGDVETAVIVRLTNDSDENVARIAIRKLGRGKNRFSIVNLIPKLRSPNIKIRKEAIGALEAMTGDNLGYKYSASQTEREKAVKMWQKLWEKNQSNPCFLEGLKTGRLSVDTKSQKRTKSRRGSQYDKREKRQKKAKGDNRSAG